MVGVLAGYGFPGEYHMQTPDYSGHREQDMCHRGIEGSITQSFCRVLYKGGETGALKLASNDEAMVRPGVRIKTVISIMRDVIVVRRLQSA